MYPPRGVYLIMPRLAAVPLCVVAGPGGRPLLCVAVIAIVRVLGAPRDGDIISLRAPLSPLSLVAIRAAPPPMPFAQSNFV